MPVLEKLTRFLMLEDLKIISWNKAREGRFNIVVVEKTSDFEICKKCGSKSKHIFDHRTVNIRDSLIRGKAIYLRVRKRKFFCSTCRKPFTEPVAGIWPKRRSTERYRRNVLWACENFHDLKLVQKSYRCSSGFIYKAVYEQVRLRLKSRLNYP